MKKRGCFLYLSFKDTFNTFRCIKTRLFNSDFKPIHLQKSGYTPTKKWVYTPTKKWVTYKTKENQYTYKKVGIHSNKPKVYVVIKLQINIDM